MLDDILLKTKNASKSLAVTNKETREKCLANIRDLLLEEKTLIINENNKDLEAGRLNGLSNAMLERLTLNEKRIDGLASSINDLIKLDDVIGEVIESVTRPNGIRIDKVRVPFGVIGAIFESRPNVSVDIACLCLKTANACVLKGGKEAINTNKVLVGLMKKAVEGLIDPNSITLIESTDRATTDLLITKKEYIDVLIPRGGKGLIQYVVGNAKIPYIETGAGNCHLYVHEDALVDMAIDIAVNAKYQRPSVCNAIENILVDEKIAPVFLPKLYDKFTELKIEMRGCVDTQKYISVGVASDEDYYTEYNDYIVAIKVVKNLNEAIEHINEHSTKHSEAIITENDEAYVRFMNEVDSACVYHNASTRFTDGGEFGFGAEIGISTQKLHARGPMGLKEICSYKYKIYGNGQVRK